MPETGGADEPDEIAATLVDALVQTSFATMAVLTRLGADHDLSLTQLRALGILRGRRLRMAALAGFLGLDKSTLSGLIDRAEKRGLVTRESSPTDGRVVEVFLSPTGVQLADRLSSEVAHLLTPLSNALGRADQRRLQGLLFDLLQSTGPPAGRRD
ncbi:MAG: transcriptional regulator, MarR family [Pseudonocardiales bacterium]|nr:transcriptional regulator, MarR family [Pseudonocardiales bacterium]